ncbi:MAG: hypothetical protein ACTIJ9_05050 [Aequorivita sp.]
MNFDNIKAKMDSERMDETQIPTRIKDLETSKMPIQKVRRSMRSEIIIQLVCIVIFFAAPSFIEMNPLPQGIYYIFMFITSLITLGYLAKMTWFINKTSDLNKASKNAVITFIYELKLTLEVYKTAIISGSLLLPISVFALLFGIEKDPEVFTNIILLNISTTSLILYIIGYIVFALVIYVGTIAWSNSLYGVHIKALEKTLKEFNL